MSLLASHKSSHQLKKPYPLRTLPSTQYLRHSHERIKALEAKTAGLEKGGGKDGVGGGDASAATVGDAAVQLGLYGGAMGGADGPLLLANEAYNPMAGGYEQHGYGAGGGGGGGYAGAGYGMAPAYGGPQQGMGGAPGGQQQGFGGYAPQGGYGGQW